MKVIYHVHVTNIEQKTQPSFQLLNVKNNNLMTENKQMLQFLHHENSTKLTSLKISITS